ncbi:MAG: hypothetical protein EOO81_08205 [Oxalobacteraceae bacterium]|nr:MAG: hypothetical protein EOO81_08205 [Oxalobacteraceae bacterium]
MPDSILAGVYDAAAKHLGIADVGHRSAVANVQAGDALSLFAAVHDAVCRNYVTSNATANKDRSSQNWRWHSPQPQISAHNTSAEVILERAVAAAAVALARTDWSNQVPVASGLVSRTGDRRRAIDLVRRMGEKHFQLIELKISSDTPLYAAVELLGYASLLLIARADPPSRATAILDADTIGLRVLAPAAFYSGYELRELGRALDAGVRALGLAHDVTMSFAFAVLDEALCADALPSGSELLNLFDCHLGLHDTQPRRQSG